MKKLLCSLAGVVALGLSFQASAGPVTFSISGDSDVGLASYSGFGGLPIISLSDGLVGSSATLSAGETWEFDFFSIALPVIGAGTGTIAASLAFDAPTSAPDAEGSAHGSFLSFLFSSAGDLTWITQPDSFTLLDGTSYSVAFQNLSGVTWGRSVDVRAYLTLDTEPVPEPGTLLLMALGLAGVIYASRRQLAARRP